MMIMMIFPHVKNFIFSLKNSFHYLFFEDYLNDKTDLRGKVPPVFPRETFQFLQISVGLLPRVRPSIEHY
jgi:hypothetical protein